jgi:deoxyribonuclease IV
MEKKILIGAHTSIAGGVFNALKHGEKIGATVIQIFTANQKQWKSKPIPKKDLDVWFQLLEDTKISHVMSHDSYLINLGSHKSELLEKSKDTFSNEIRRCHSLDLDYLNFHPGTATDKNIERCLDTIIESLLSMENLINQGITRLLIETTAGQGNSVGHIFDQIGYIVKNVASKIPIGVCIDTCHIFSAGYDIRDSISIDATLKEFDHKIGLKYLYAFHLNDSKHILGSKKDRHANLGKGEIGMKCFEYLMQSPLTKHIPKYLETPNGDTYWEDEIKQLKNFTIHKTTQSI